MRRGQTVGTETASCEVIGLDVAKDTLCLAWGSAPKAPVKEIANTRSSLRKELRGLSSNTILGLESTGSYHRLACQVALEQGLTVYLLNPKDVKHYSASVQARAKTDVGDARVIARYVENEHNHLRPYQEPPPQVERIEQLLRRRGLASAERVRWSQHLGTEKKTSPYRAIEKSLKKLIKDVDEETNLCFAAEPALAARRARLSTIPGVGPVISAALAAVLAKHNFTSADSFVAFLGLDLKVQDSGQHKGLRRLTKRGDPELRRLLFTAAMSVCSRPAWKPYYQACLGRGLSRTEALVVLSRRIARTAWSMDHRGTEFSRDRLFTQPPPQSANDHAAASVEVVAVEATPIETALNVENVVDEKSVKAKPVSKKLAVRKSANAEAVRTDPKAATTVRERAKLKSSGPVAEEVAHVAAS